jgi:spore coat protein U-like protein
VTCDTPVAGISLSLISLSQSPRHMEGSTGDRLEYEIYLDDARTVVWGDGGFGSQPLSIQHPGGTLTLPIYGRIFPGQRVHAGVYRDSLRILASF